MTLHAVLGNADHDRADRVEIGLRLGEALGLAGAAGGVVLGIEIQHHDPLAQSGEADVAAVVAGQAELGRLIAGLQGGRHGILRIGMSPDYEGRSAKSQSQAWPADCVRGRGFPAC